MDKELLEELYHRTLFMISLGTPLTTSRDLDRAVKRARVDVIATIAKIHGIEWQDTPMTEEEKKEAKRISDTYGIKFLWLTEAADK